MNPSSFSFSSTSNTPSKALPYQSAIGKRKQALGGSALVTRPNGVDAGPQWNGKQQAMLLLESIPIVWTRRIDGVGGKNGTGGVVVAPKATACRISVSGINGVAIAYHLVVSEGKIGGIQVRDVFHGPCRVGSYSQSFGKRAGDWLPGNTIHAAFGNRVKLAPTFCGTVGTFEGISTLSFQATYLNGYTTEIVDGISFIVPLEDQELWQRKVNIFVRNGAQSTRLTDNVYGSSNNLAELYYWLLTHTGRIPEIQIDRDSLTTTAKFMAANGLFWDGILTEPSSTSDWLSRVGLYFLVRSSTIGGRYGMRPLLPVTPSGAIDTEPQKPAWVFDGEAIVDGSYSYQLADPKARQPYRAEVAWRQQGDDGLSGITRTATVKYEDTPDSAPIEPHDMTQFATSKGHAVKAMRFTQAKRRYVTHTAQVIIKAGYWNARIGEGDLIAIQLDREDVDGVDDPLVEWYLIVSMKQGREGQLSLELEHFPVDPQSRSLVALDVASVLAEEDLFITGSSVPSCDADPSRATDTSIPAEDAESRTAEEVYFYNENGRFPDSGEYASGGAVAGEGDASFAFSSAPAAGPTGSSGGGGGAGSSGGGGSLWRGEAAPPAPQPPTGPVDPPGIPSQPDTPTGPANPPVPPKEPPAGDLIQWSLQFSWTLNPDYPLANPGAYAGIVIENRIIKVGPGQRAVIVEQNLQSTFVAAFNPDGTATGLPTQYQHLINGSYQQTWPYIFDRGVLSGPFPETTDPASPPV
jgi:hypothetical protein